MRTDLVAAIFMTETAERPVFFVVIWDEQMQRWRNGRKVKKLLFLKHSLFITTHSAMEALTPTSTGLFSH